MTFADLIVLDRDPLKVPAEDIIKVQLAIFDGACHVIFVELISGHDCGYAQNGFARIELGRAYYVALIDEADEMPFDNNEGLRNPSSQTWIDRIPP